MTFDAPPPPPSESSFPGGPPPPYPNPTGGHPVQLTIARSETQSRVLAFFSLFYFLGRTIMLIPAYIVLVFVGIAAFLVAWIAQWAILFTGSSPQGMHDFVVGYSRWSARVNAYALGVTDAYPPFRLSP
jgi:hypothetical protein